MCSSTLTALRKWFGPCVALHAGFKVGNIKLNYDANNENSNIVLR
jgi:hypothetical protein